MVEQRADLRAQAADETLSECAHHWQIETPAGETSLGICKRCGATRNFANYSQRRTTARPVKTSSPGNGAQRL